MNCASGSPVFSSTRVILRTTAPRYVSMKLRRATRSRLRFFDTAETLLDLADHNVQILERGGRVSLVFHFDENLSEDDFEEAKRRVREQYGGASKAGEIGVTAGEGMTIKEIGVNAKDADFAGLQIIASESVAMLYHIPLQLISSSRQTLSTY